MSSGSPRDAVIAFQQKAHAPITFILGITGDPCRPVPTLPRFIGQYVDRTRNPLRPSRGDIVCKNMEICRECSYMGGHGSSCSKYENPNPGAGPSGVSEATFEPESVPPTP